jgi:energy-converting hydrogenase Eha subunit F
MSDNTGQWNLSDPVIHMKKFLLTTISSAVGAIIGNILYTRTLGAANEYHWERTVFFGFFFGIVVFFWKRRKKE